MLAHALEETDFAALDPQDFSAEWKWDGIRVQAVKGEDARGRQVAKLYSRTGEDISGAFPDLVDAIDSIDVLLAVDGELLVVVEGASRPFRCCSSGSTARK